MLNLRVYVHGGEPAVPLWAHRFGDGPGGVGYVHDFRRGATGFCHILCYGSTADGNRNNLVLVSVLPQGKEGQGVIYGLLVWLYGV